MEYKSIGCKESTVCGRKVGKRGETCADGKLAERREKSEEESGKKREQRSGERRAYPTPPERFPLRRCYQLSSSPRPPPPMDRCPTAARNVIQTVDPAGLARAMYSRRYLTPRCTRSQITFSGCMMSDTGTAEMTVGRCENAATVICVRPVFGRALVTSKASADGRRRETRGRRPANKIKSGDLTSDREAQTARQAMGDSQRTLIVTAWGS